MTSQLSSKVIGRDYLLICGTLYLDAAKMECVSGYILETSIFISFNFKILLIYLTHNSACS